MSDSFSAFDVASSAMRAQRRRMELLITNMANSQTTRTPEGGPYQRKDVIFRSRPFQSFEEIFLELTDGAPTLEGVDVSRVVVSDDEPILRLEPGHPDADENGYVAYPDINPLEEMANLVSATRSFEASVRAFEAVKELVQRSIEIGRS